MEKGRKGKGNTSFTPFILSPFILLSFHPINLFKPQTLHRVHQRGFDGLVADRY
jgi:hypothetical protein